MRLPGYCLRAWQSSILAGLFVGQMRTRHGSSSSLTPPTSYGGALFPCGVETGQESHVLPATLLITCIPFFLKKRSGQSRWIAVIGVRRRLRTASVDRVCLWVKPQRTSLDPMDCGAMRGLILQRICGVRACGVRQPILGPTARLMYNIYYYYSGTYLQVKLNTPVPISR